MTGETKQMIDNVRAEYRRLLLARRIASDEMIGEKTLKAIEDFEQYLQSIDEEVEHQVPPLGISAGDHAPVKDVFGGDPTPVVRPVPSHQPIIDDRQPGLGDEV